MELSSLALNLRALGLISDAPLNVVIADHRLFDESSQEETSSNGGVEQLKEEATASVSEAATLAPATDQAGGLQQQQKGEEGSGDSSGLRIISLDEVAWHDTIDDCWLVVYDYVYDCTSFVRNHHHPGGQDVLLEYAGRDATLAFVGTGHSRGANRILEKFLIGELPPSERIFRTSNGIKIGDLIV